MRKGQFIFNFLRDYMGDGTFENPYPNCHWVIFNISDEYWATIEDEFKKFNNSPQHYKFPKKPFGDSIISKEHKKAMKTAFADLREFGFDDKI